MRGWTFKTTRGRLDASRVSSVWSRFGHHTVKYWPQLLISFAAAIGTIATQIAAPWTIKIIFDYVLSDTMAPSWMTRALSFLATTGSGILAWTCGAILVIAILDALFAYVRDVTLAQVGQRVIGRIRQDLFAHLQTLSPVVLERQSTGDLLTRLTGDIRMLRNLLVNAIVTAGQNVLLIITMISVMFWLNPTLTLLVLATFPITIWMGRRISKQIRKATHSQREKESVVAGLAHDVLDGMAIVQAFNREAIERKRFSRQNRSSVRAGVKMTKLQSKLSRVAALATAVSMCAVLYVGVGSVLDGVMTAGDLLVFIAYLRGVNKPMRQIAKLASQAAKATSCGERVGEVFAIAPTVTDGPNARPLDGPRGSITYEDVTFDYELGGRALSSVSFSIEAGERVAVVGHTGAGKSTIAKLLLRFFDPMEGRICIDGRPLEEVTLQSLRQNIGWVHQDTLLFGMTVAENIALGRPDAEDDLIREVARLVQAEEFIEAMPKGYDTRINHGGSNISGGQRQRIALARALLREAPILLLDEPATGLDAVTRRIVEEAWLSPSNKSTTIVICHRLRNMARFNHILVLSEGVVRGFGTHEELMATCSTYALQYKAGIQEPHTPVEGNAC